MNLKAMNSIVVTELIIKEKLQKNKQLTAYNFYIHYDTLTKKFSRGPLND